MSQVMLSACAEKPDGAQVIRWPSDFVDVPHAVLQWMASYFDPRRHHSLPAWAFPEEINPIHIAHKAAAASAFAELPLQEQMDWFALAQVARDARPDIQAALVEMKQAAHSKEKNWARMRMLMVQNELVLRAVESKLILQKVEAIYQQASQAACFKGLLPTSF